MHAPPLTRRAAPLVAAADSCHPAVGDAARRLPQVNGPLMQETSRSGSRRLVLRLPSTSAHLCSASFWNTSYRLAAQSGAERARSYTDHPASCGSASPLDCGGGNTPWISASPIAATVN